jgi:hypothetical protein
MPDNSQQHVTCRNCGLEKIPEKYYGRGDGRLDAVCKECRKKQRNIRYRQNKTSISDSKSNHLAPITEVHQPSCENHTHPSNAKLRDILTKEEIANIVDVFMTLAAWDGERDAIELECDGDIPNNPL